MAAPPLRALQVKATMANIELQDLFAACCLDCTADILSSH